MSDLDDWDGPGCCPNAPDPEDCFCDEDGYSDSCWRCGGSGYYVPDHCCVCGGSPYCNCCRKCEGDSVGNCTCPITVPLESGKTLTL